MKLDIVSWNNLCSELFNKLGLEGGLYIEDTISEKSFSFTIIDTDSKTPSIKKSCGKSLERRLFFTIILTPPPLRDSLILFYMVYPGKWKDSRLVDVNHVSCNKMMSSFTSLLLIIPSNNDKSVYLLGKEAKLIKSIENNIMIEGIDF